MSVSLLTERRRRVCLEGPRMIGVCLEGPRMIVDLCLSKSQVAKRTASFVADTYILYVYWECLSLFYII
jgi:hypothetical protein